MPLLSRPTHPDLSEFFPNNTVLDRYAQHLLTQLLVLANVTGRSDFFASHQLLVECIEELDRVRSDVLSRFDNDISHLRSVEADDSIFDEKAWYIEKEKEEYVWRTAVSHEAVWFIKNNYFALTEKQRIGVQSNLAAAMFQYVAKANTPKLTSNYF